MKKQARRALLPKLALHRETLILLCVEHLDQVAGGYVSEGCLTPATKKTKVCLTQ
jgi:hypothetical protein